MLSYQHAYHAGNLADVHKHALLCGMLAYLTAKDKPLSYIETHAGRGLYDLGGPEALQTGEAAHGIAAVTAQGWFADDHPYSRAMARVRDRFGPAAYPGSPLLAATFLRPGDRATVAELHPAEYERLAAAMAGLPVTCRRIDGAELALALTPPEPRRGLMLIDPSYEVRGDYAAMPRLVGAVARKWNVGTLALWYPILPDGRHAPMLAALEAMPLPRTLRHEVGFAPARPGHGLVGSGMFLVNAPYGTDAEAARLSGLFAGR